MKIALREDRPFLALCPRGHTSRQQNHRDTNRPRYPAPYESLYLVHDFSFQTVVFFLKRPAALIQYGVRPALVPKSYGHRNGLLSKVDAIPCDSHLHLQ
jgi:hypothetical protein